MQQNIVDQAGGTNISSHRNQCPAQGIGHRLETIRIDNFEVIQTYGGLFAHNPATGSGKAARVGLAAICQSLHAHQRTVEYSCLAALVRTEISIPRTHGQSVRFAHDWADHDLKVEVEIVDHLTDDRGLRRILLSEEGQI